MFNKIKKKAKGFTLARSFGNAEMILNAVGRLSSLNGLVAIDGTPGGNGRNDDFNN